MNYSSFGIALAESAPAGNGGVIPPADGSSITVSGTINDSELSKHLDRKLEAPNRQPLRESRSEVASTPSVRPGYLLNAGSEWDQTTPASGELMVRAPDVQTKARFTEESSGEKKAVGFDWYLGNKTRNDPKWAGTLEPTPSAQPEPQSARNRLAGDQARRDTSLSRDQVPQLGDGPVSVTNFMSLATTGQGGGRPHSIELPGLTTKAQGIEQKAAELRVAKPVNPDYAKKQRELQELLNYRQLVARKMNLEQLDLNLPRSAQVEIVDSAVAETLPSTGWLGKVRGAFSSEVERVARIKVGPDKSDIDEVASSGRRFNPYDPYFVTSESETIQSEAVLGKVVEQLKLDEVWAKKKGAESKLKKSEAIAMLRGQLDLRSIPNTSMVEIGAKGAKPEEAAQLANAVAQAYKEWRKERGQRLVSAGIAQLSKRLAEQDKRIYQAKEELDQLREQLKISEEDAVAEFGSATIRKPAGNAAIPQPEILSRENNFSTFSLNVSDVSFKLAAASLEQGQLPDAASIRSEEFINAFDYRDPEAPAGSPIAFAWERARYPFAHNRDLLRFSLKTAAAGRPAGRPLNLVLLLDNSGSMERADRVRIVREALRVLATQLQPQDKLSVITFARTARLVADGIAGDKANEVMEQVGGLTPQGGTNLEDAMNLAYQTAARHYVGTGVNRVVLLTDGAANLGAVAPEALQQKVTAQRQQGVALDCFGIGWEGFNDDLLEVLSRNGDGRYGFINSPEEAATDFAAQLAGALQVAASDVKVQVEFNPQRVTSYRQIGYAKHQLKKEQFRDNTVDAAEIAAQEAGNALYTVEVNPVGSGPIATVRVRYKVPGTTDYRERSWDVPYAGGAVALEQSSPAMRLAATASAFSEWLMASPFAPEVTPDELLKVLRGVPEVYGADSRPTKLEWMIRQAKRLAGQ